MESVDDIARVCVQKYEIDRKLCTEAYALRKEGKSFCLYITWLRAVRLSSKPSLIK